jgi:hypothetical protein
MDEFTPQIYSQGGQWAETEVLGNYAIVKVRASDATLTTIAATEGFQRLPLTLLTESLSSLTGAQRTSIRNRLIAMGYTDTEINTALGANIGQRTLGQVLRFAASRRLKPRYDAMQDLIVLDGPVQTCRLIEDVDNEVQ